MDFVFWGVWQSLGTCHFCCAIAITIAITIAIAIEIAIAKLFKQRPKKQTCIFATVVDNNLMEKTR